MENPEQHFTNGIKDTKKKGYKVYMIDQKHQKTKGNQQLGINTSK